MEPILVRELFLQLISEFPFQYWEHTIAMPRSICFSFVLIIGVEPYLWHARRCELEVRVSNESLLHFGHPRIFCTNFVLLSKALSSRKWTLPLDVLT